VNLTGPESGLSVNRERNQYDTMGYAGMNLEKKAYAWSGNQKQECFKMNSATIHHTPAGLVVETGKESYLVSDKDMPLLRRGQSVPLRDMGRGPLGPAGCVYTRHGNVEVRLPSGEVLAIPGRLMQVAKSNIRRVILTSPSPMAVV